MYDGGVFVWHGAAMAAGHPQQDAAHYLLCGAAFVFCNDGRDFYIGQPVRAGNAGSVHDGDGCLQGALIGLPPSLVEIYGGDIKKMYKANGVPLYFGLIPALLSTFLHLMLMSAVIYLAAPPAFGAAAPADPAAYFGALAVFTAASLSVGGVLGVAVRDQAKLTMFSQLVFLPSILLSGIMFPSELLPGVLGAAGRIFPASWGFCLMKDGGFSAGNLWPLALVMAMSSVLCMLLLKRLERE